LVVAGLWAMWHTSFRAAALLAAAVGVCQAIPYWFLTGHANPRYLLPSYALAAIPAAMGLRRLSTSWRRRLPGAFGAVLAPAIVVLFLGHQLFIAAQISHRAYEGRLEQLRMGERLVELGIRPPCLVYGRSAPQIAHVPHCAYRGVLVGDLPDGAAARKVERRLTRDVAKGKQVVVVGANPNRYDFLPEWQRLKLTPDSGYVVLLPPNR
jgi:hypothetical protein